MEPYCRIKLITLLLPLMVFGCALLVGGSRPISPALRPLYEQALESYQQGDWSEARRLLQQVVKQNSRAIMARYWLGMTHLQLGELDQARSQFRRITAIDRKSSYGYYGLGLYYAQRKNQGLMARKYFKEAIKRDPTLVDAHWQLALIRLRMASGLLGSFSLAAVRQAFQRVIELDARHPQAYYVLATTYYAFQEQGDYQRAIPLLQKQVEVNPNHWEAWFDLGKAHLEMKQFDQAETAFRHLIQGNPDYRVQANRLLAYAKMEAGFYQSQVGLEAFFTLLEEEEKRHYFDLQYVVTNADSVIQLQNSLSLEELRENARLFWARYDPLPLTPLNERFYEHCRRTAYARRHFSRGKQPWDRRGEIYIRFGAPAEREEFTIGAGDPEQLALSAGEITLSTQTGIKRAERWRYLEPSQVLTFVDEAGDFNYDFPVPGGPMDVAYQAQQLRQHPLTTVSKIIKETPEVYVHDYGGERALRFAYALATFRGDSRRTRLEVYYAVPASDLRFARTDPLSVQADLALGVVLFDSTWQEVARVEEQSVFSTPAEPNQRRTLVAFYQQVVATPPGTYQVAVQVQDRQSQNIGIYRRSVRVDDYSPGPLKISTVELARTIRGEGDSRFRKGTRFVYPNPTGIYQKGEPIYLYFEIYNLVPDEQEQTAYRLTYGIILKSGGEGLAARVLTAPVRLFSSEGDGQTLTMQFKERAAATTLRRDQAIDMASSPAGAYTLTLSVEDLNSGQQALRQVDFELRE